MHKFTLFLFHFFLEVQILLTYQHEIAISPHRRKLYTFTAKTIETNLLAILIN